MSSKQRLFEYCQKSKISPPQFVTTGSGTSFSSAVVVQRVEVVEECQTFYSREVHTTKKKAENDSAEVALEFVNARPVKPLVGDAKLTSGSDIGDLIVTIEKAVNSCRPGIKHVTRNYCFLLG